MTQDFLRRLEGYNRFRSDYSVASIARNSSLTHNLLAGPGRVRLLSVRAYEAYPGTIDTNSMTITLDGASAFNGSVCDLANHYTCVGYINNACNRYGSASFNFVSWNIPMYYESSAAITVVNTASPDPCQFLIAASYDVGR